VLNPSYALQPALSAAKYGADSADLPPPSPDAARNPAYACCYAKTLFLRINACDAEAPALLIAKEIHDAAG
jgi:hypothetical protein